MYIKNLSYITETYPQYNVQRGKKAKKYTRVLYKKIGPIPTK